MGGWIGMGFNLKILSLTIIALLLASMALPATIVYAEDTASDHPMGQPVVERTRFLDNITFEELLDLAYMVRNETYPLLEWAIGYNSTVATRIKSRGDWFFEKAMEYRDVDERLAKVALVIAIITYSHAPISAYQVLITTVRNNLGENNTITNETVYAVQDIAGELRELVVNAREYALEHNVSLPYLVEALILRGDYRLQKSQEMLGLNKTKIALALAIGGYIDYAKAYGIIVRSTIVDFVREHGTDIRRLKYVVGLTSMEEIRRRIELLKPKLPSWINITVAKEGIKFVILPINKDLMIDRLTNYIMYHIIRIANKRPMIRAWLVSKYGFNWRHDIREIIRNKLMEKIGEGGSLRDLIKEVIMEIFGYQYQIELPHSIIVIKRH